MRLLGLLFLVSLFFSPVIRYHTGETLVNVGQTLQSTGHR